MIKEIGLIQNPNVLSEFLREIYFRLLSEHKSERGFLVSFKILNNFLSNFCLKHFHFWFFLPGNPQVHIVLKILICCEVSVKVPWSYNLWTYCVLRYQPLKAMNTIQIKSHVSLWITVYECLKNKKCWRAFQFVMLDVLQFEAWYNVNYLIPFMNPLILFSLCDHSFVKASP